MSDSEVVVVEGVVGIAEVEIVVERIVGVVVWGVVGAVAFGPSCSQGWVPRNGVFTCCGR